MLAISNEPHNEKIFFGICGNKDAFVFRTWAETSKTGSRDAAQIRYEPRRQKTGLRGFRPGPTQTGLRSH